MEQDKKTLDILGILHYVLGGITIMFSSIFLIHVFLGLGIVTGRLDKTESPDPTGWIFVGVGIAAILTGWALGILILVAGSKLRKSSSYVFCMVIAAIECMFTPLGTALGVITIITLLKDPVRELFATRSSAEIATPGG